MHIERLKLRDFRNYENAELEFSPLTNVIYGDNAQGKTNILEAVYLFAQGRSHRAKSDKELIRFRWSCARLGLDFSDSRRSYSCEMKISHNGRKSVSVNHVHIMKLSKLMSYLNVVMFSPEDLDIVKGSPSARRRFIDSCVSQIYPSYLSSLMDYNKTLAQKNSLLKLMRSKSKRTDPTLSVWNGQLAEEGSRIMRFRADFIELINATAAAIQSEISGETLALRYMPSIKTESMTAEEIFEYLSEREGREADMGSSMYGVQRDDIEIFVNGREAKLFGSQGQQRTAALSMKIAQSEYIKNIKGEYPVLLLDDIMSELDIHRRMYLSERIRDKQVLITSTDTDLIDKNTDTRLFRIENGKVM